MKPFFIYPKRSKYKNALKKGNCLLLQFLWDKKWSLICSCDDDSNGSKTISSSHGMWLFFFKTFAHLIHTSDCVGHWVDYFRDCEVLNLRLPLSTLRNSILFKMSLHLDITFTPDILQFQPKWQKNRSVQSKPNLSPN